MRCLTQTPFFIYKIVYILTLYVFIDTLNVKLTFHRGDDLKNILERLRQERGIKQEDLAKAMGVSRQTIGSLENGRYNPSILLAYKLAYYFDLKIEDIFIYEENYDEKI